MKDCRRYFEAMPGAYRRSAGARMTAVYQFELSGDGGGQWGVALREGELSVAQGRHDRPDVTIAASAEDYCDIAEGRLGSMRALATGRLKVRGSLALALKLPGLFHTTRA